MKGYRIQGYKLNDIEYKDTRKGYRIQGYKLEDIIQGCRIQDTGYRIQDTRMQGYKDTRI